MTKYRVLRREGGRTELARITKVDAVAYIEWGGAYDMRELELIEYRGKHWYEDLTGGSKITLHDVLKQDHESAEEAKLELIRFCFDLGEACTYIDFGEQGGIVHKRDCRRGEKEDGWNWRPEVKER